MHELPNDHIDCKETVLASFQEELQRNPEFAKWFYDLPTKNTLAPSVVTIASIAYYRGYSQGVKDAAAKLNEHINNTLGKPDADT